MSDNDSLIERLNILINDANERQTATIKQDIQAKVSEVKLEIVELKKIIETEKAKVNTLEKTQIDLEIKYKTLQKSLRKNNLVIFGVKLDNKPNSLPEYIIQKINQWLQLNLTVSCLDNAYLLGRSELNRPILVKLQSFLTKVQILKECKKLRGTGISISEDLTREERENLKILTKYKKLALNKGHKAYIRNLRLYVDDEEHTLEELQGKDKEKETDILQGQEQRENTSCLSTLTRSGIEGIEGSEQESGRHFIDDRLNVANGNGTSKEYNGDHKADIREDIEDIFNKKRKNETFHAGGSKQKEPINQKILIKTKRINTRSAK